MQTLLLPASSSASHGWLLRGVDLLLLLHRTHTHTHVFDFARLCVCTCVCAHPMPSFMGLVIRSHPHSCTNTTHTATAERETPAQREHIGNCIFTRSRHFEMCVGAGRVRQFLALLSQPYPVSPGGGGDFAAEYTFRAPIFLLWQRCVALLVTPATLSSWTRSQKKSHATSSNPFSLA